MRDQPKAVVSVTTSAISQPVLLGLSGSRSAMSKQTPARVATFGRKAHKQWLSGTRQPLQRFTREPRAMKGLVSKAVRAVRRRATAWFAVKTLNRPKPLFAQPVQGANLVAVRVAKVRQVELAHRAVAKPWGLLAGGAAVGNASRMECVTLLR